MRTWQHQNQYELSPDILGISRHLTQKSTKQMNPSISNTLVTIRKTKAYLGIIVTALVAMPLASFSQSSIGINFAGRQWSIGGDTPMTLSASDSAGVIGQLNWNNVFLDGADSGGMPQLNIGFSNAGVVSDSSGAATGVTFSYTRNGNATEWAVDKTIHAGNQQLLDGYWDIQSVSGTVNFGNLPFSLYDVYVYVSADSNGRTAGVDINGGSQTYLLTDANGFDYSGALIQGTATSQGAAAPAQYVLFQSVSGSSLQVDLFNYGNDVGIAGIQIVAVPEPSTFVLSAVGLALAGLMRRRCCLSKAKRGV
jgi:hypothetical protein